MSNGSWVQGNEELEDTWTHSLFWTYSSIAFLPFWYQHCICFRLWTLGFLVQFCTCCLNYEDLSCVYHTHPQFPKPQALQIWTESYFSILSSPTGKYLIIEISFSMSLCVNSAKTLLVYLASWVYSVLVENPE